MEKEEKEELHEGTKQIILVSIGIIFGMAIMMCLTMSGFVGHHAYRQEIIKTFCDK